MIKSLFSFILIILLFLASLGLVVYRLQNAQFVVSQARTVNLYGRLTENVSALLPEEETKGLTLSHQDITDILKMAIDSEQFYGFLTSALTAYLPWLTGQTNESAFSYDLTTVKQKLASGAAAKLLVKYDALTMCNQSQLRQWSFDDGLPSCRLPEGTLAAKSIDNQIRAAVTKPIDNLPDTITSGSPSDQLVKVRDKIAIAFKVIYGLWAVTILMTLLFLGLYRARAFVTLAITFLIVGVLQVAFSLVGWDWISRTLSDLISGMTGAKSVVPVTIDLISVILGAMKTTFGNISIVFLGAGVALLVLGIITKLHQPKIVEKIS